MEELRGLKRYSRQDLNDMKVMLMDRRYIDYFEVVRLLETPKHETVEEEIKESN